MSVRIFNDQFNTKYNVVVSLDDHGMIEYWSSSSFEFPNNVGFKLKIDTDLYEIIKVI